MASAELIGQVQLKIHVQSCPSAIARGVERRDGLFGRRKCCAVRSRARLPRFPQHTVNGQMPSSRELISPQTESQLASILHDFADQSPSGHLAARLLVDPHQIWLGC